jgi:hypothetical protein
MIHRENLRNLATAVLLIGAAVLLWSLLFPGRAHAQLGAQAVITVPGSVTSDQPTETSTGDLDTNLVPQIVSSVTTGGGGGDYQPNAQYIASLDQQLFSGINSQNFNTWFPGWQALPPNSTDTVSIPMTKTVLSTYGNALALVQSQEQELEGEDFSNIENTLSTTTNLLTATQALSEAVLQNSKEQQYVRQLLATLITVEATKAGEEMNERAQQSATNAMFFNLGVAP